ncbi:hypothetical protein BH23VER1_BH23VER1_32260 [soil metagenome]
MKVCPQIQKPKRARSRSRGVALIIVFWLIAILSLSIFTAIRVVRNDVTVMISNKKSFRATQLAEMGIAIGANPVVKKTDLALLNQQVYEDEGFRVQIKGEGGKFNINALLLAPDRDLLEGIFVSWGLEPEEASDLVSAMIDWTDGNDLEQLNGAESEYYLALGFENYPFNRPFYSLDEMQLVKGFDLAMLLRPNWRSFFTIYGAGKLDVNEADPALIAVAAEVPIEEAIELVELRWGPDGIEDTEDDYEFGSLGEVAGLLGIAPDREPFVTPRLTLRDETTRIESVGTVGNLSKKIVVVVNSRNGRPQILIREEVSLF